MRLGPLAALFARADDVAADAVDRETIARAIGVVTLRPSLGGSLGIDESDTLWRVRRLSQPGSERRILGIGVLAASLAIVAEAIRLAARCSCFGSRRSPLPRRLGLTGGI